MIAVTYAPTATGSHEGQLSVSSNTLANSRVVALSGSAVPVPTPAASLSQASVAFGSQRVGTASAAQSVVLSNIGDADLVISGIGTSGDFSVTGCAPASLPPGGTCTLSILFEPSTTGARSGTVTITSNAAGSPHAIALSGTGTAPAIALSAGHLEFGAQTLGIASNPQAVTVSNTGTATLEILSISATGDFGFIGCATPLSLAAGESCQLAIKFLPTAIGERTGSVALTTNAAGSPHAIALIGSGTPAPVPGIAITPAAVDFGTIQAGSSAVAHLSLTNTGTAALSITGISTSSPDFTHTSTCPPSLAPSAACDISVTYAPTGEGSHSGELQIASNAVPSPFAVPLFGFATPAHTPLLDLSSTSVVFPSLFVGQTSAPRTVTLLNYGLEPLRISEIVSTGDFGYGGCGTSTTLLTGESCVFSITFRPLSVGALAGAIEVRSNAPGSPHTISLAGTGVSIAIPEISLAPANLSFGAQAVGASLTQSMTLTNTGGTALQISSISVAGSFFTQSNDCPASLAVGSSCRIAVTYAPTSIGAHNASWSSVERHAQLPCGIPRRLRDQVAPAFLIVDRSRLRRAGAGNDRTRGPAADQQRRRAFGHQLGPHSLRPRVRRRSRRLHDILRAESLHLDVTIPPGAGRFLGAPGHLLERRHRRRADTAGGRGFSAAAAGPGALVDGLGWGNQVVGTRASSASSRSPASAARRCASLDRRRPRFRRQRRAVPGGAGAEGHLRRLREFQAHRARPQARAAHGEQQRGGKRRLGRASPASAAVTSPWARRAIRRGSARPEREVRECPETRTLQA